MMLTCWRRTSSSHGLKRCAHKSRDDNLLYNVFYLVGRCLTKFALSFLCLHNMWLVLKVSKKYVSKELAKEIHAKAAPFVKWLKEAEEESEGSEEEEEEDDGNVKVNQFNHYGSRFI